MGLVGRSTETLAYIIQNTAANYAKCFWKPRQRQQWKHAYLISSAWYTQPKPEPNKGTWTRTPTSSSLNLNKEMNGTSDTLNTNWLFSPKWLDFAEMCCTKGIQGNWISCTWNTFPLYVTAFSSTLKPQRCPCRSSTPFETSFFFLTTSLKLKLNKGTNYPPNQSRLMSKSRMHSPGTDAVADRRPQHALCLRPPAVPQWSPSVPPPVLRSSCLRAAVPSADVETPPAAPSPRRCARSPATGRPPPKPLTLANYLCTIVNIAYYLCTIKNF